MAALEYVARRVSVLVAACVLTGLVSATPSASQAQTQPVRKVEKPDLRVGDTWVRFYPYNGETRPSVLKAIKDGKVYVEVQNICNRDYVYNLEWAQLEGCDTAPMRRSRQLVAVTYNPPIQYMPFPVSDGQTWSLQYRTEGDRDFSVHEGRAVGWEIVTVPAGKFEALKIEVIRKRSGGTESRFTRWYSPEINGFVKTVRRPEGQDDSELVSYKRGEGK